MYIKYLCIIKGFILSLFFAHITQANEDLIVTVYVHGTQPGILARHNFFYRKLGLHTLTSYELKHHKCSIGHTLIAADPQSYDPAHYYIFGWSGKLSPQDRSIAAQELAQEIIKLQDKYRKEHGSNFKLRVITHSHGGTVVYKLAKLKEAEDIVIDELIVLACPIVPESQDLHKHPMFKKVYAFYADNDFFQVADKLAHASGRYFSPSHNLIQGCIKVKKQLAWHLITHASFTTSTFMRHLPRVCATAEQYYTEHAAQEVTTPPTITIKKKHIGQYCIKAHSV